MLGSSINPDARVRCDVYMVMKGIVAGWTITGQGNVFDKYRQTADANNALNSCVRDGFVSVGNL